VCAVFRRFRSTTRTHAGFDSMRGLLLRVGWTFHEGQVPPLAASESPSANPRNPLPLSQQKWWEIPFLWPRREWRSASQQSSKVWVRGTKNGLAEALARNSASARYG
jgi:hypothetical protein